MKWNNISDARKLRSGQKLVVRADAAKHSTTSAIASTSSQPTHTSTSANELPTQSPTFDNLEEQTASMDPSSADPSSDESPADLAVDPSSNSDDDNLFGDSGEAPLVSVNQQS
jgi:hypothetical protein